MKNDGTSVCVIYWTGYYIYIKLVKNWLGMRFDPDRLRLQNMSEYEYKMWYIKKIKIYIIAFLIFYKYSFV